MAKDQHPQDDRTDGHSGRGDGQASDASAPVVKAHEHRAHEISIPASRASRSSANAGDVRIHYGGRRRGPGAL